MKLSTSFIYAILSIFIATGLVFGYGAVLDLLRRNRILNEGIQTVGTVVKEQASKYSLPHAPFLLFLDNRGDSIRYYHYTVSTDNDGHMGETRKLWYHPDNPSELILLEGEERINWFSFGLMFMLSGSAIVLLVDLERKRRQRKWLLEYGMVVQATFVEIVESLSRLFYRRYRIVCVWADPLSEYEYIFVSEVLDFNPESQIAPEAQIRVFINPDNPEQHLVDTSFLRQN